MKESKRTGNEALRRARVAKGWTQKQLAEKVCVGESSVRSWESGTRRIGPENLARLCAVLEATPEDLGLLPLLASGEVAEEQEKSLSLSLPPLEIANADGEERKTVLPSFPTARPPRDKNRDCILRRFQSRWIFDVLDQYHLPLIPLRLQLYLDAVDCPWLTAPRESSITQKNSILPAGTNIIDVFDRADGELLILGEAGAGKSTLLLELARELVTRAKQDETHPVPIIFHLPSWGQQRSSLVEWMVKELNTKYQVPWKIAQDLVEHDQILPLLDGLDEVPESSRTACMEAINQYREDHGMVPLVVCSRSTDYLPQPARLILSSAITVQPLSSDQIDEYLSCYQDENLIAIRNALQSDPLLKEIVSTPLMLSVVAQAYQGRSPDEILTVNDREERRRLVFEQYVKRVLERKGPGRYPIQQTIRWLTWLAAQMQRCNLTVFYLERMQPDWLEDRLRNRYSNTIVRLVYGIDCAVVTGIFAWFRGGRIGNVSGVGAGLLGSLGAGPGNSVLGWMAPGLGGGLEGGGALGLVIGCVTMLVVMLIDLSSPSALSFTRTQLRRGLATGVRTGLISSVIVALFCGLIFGVSGGIRNGIAAGVSYGLFCGLIVGLLRGLYVSWREPAPLLQPSHVVQRRRRNALDHLIDGCCIGIFSWISFGLINSLMVGPAQGVVYGAIVGFLSGVFYGGGGTKLIPRLGLDISPAETAKWSWRQVQHDLPGNVVSGLKIGFSMLPSVLVIFGLASGLFHGWQYGLRYGLVYSIILGLIVGIIVVLTGILNSGWSNNLLDEHDLNRPNEGIRRSLRNSLFAGLLFGPLGGFASGLIIGGAFGLVGGLPGWLILGSGFAIVFTFIFAVNFALMRGGVACIEHYLLRWYLWRAGCIPLNFVHFLDDAAEHILVRKVGGGYMFTHRLVLEYFVALNEEEDASLMISSSST